MIYVLCGMFRNRRLCYTTSLQAPHNECFPLFLTKASSKNPSNRWHSATILSIVIFSNITAVN